MSSKKLIGAVDIGGTKIAAGVVNATGRLLEQSQAPSSQNRKLEQGLDWITNTLLACAKSAGGQLAGIGIGCTGPVNPWTGVLANNSFLPDWEGNGLVQGLQDRFDVQVSIENDADAAALAEARWGSGQGCATFVYLTISTGIGGGIVLNGHLYRGAGGAHPEIGHHIIDPSGPACFCGAHGCWESLASGPAMEKWFSTNLEMNEIQLQGANAARVCHLAEQGHPLAQRAVERQAYYLGVGLSNLIDFFTPDCIALGGGVMQSWRLFQAGAQSVIRQVCGLVPYERTRILPASLGMTAPLLGAAQTWFQRYSLPED